MLGVCHYSVTIFRNGSAYDYSSVNREVFEGLANFGMTFNYFAIAGNPGDVVKQMLLAIEGKRGAITNKELGISIPKDALN